jgi:hypothetical protein
MVTAQAFISSNVLDYIDLGYLKVKCFAKTENVFFNM